MIKHLTIQEHDAERAGLHWDLRIGSFGDGLQSWVIPKCRLPDTEQLLAIKVKDHCWDYRNFEGKIEEGYGKGTVKLICSEEVEVHSWSDRKISFTLGAHRYSLFTFSGAKWFLIRKKGT